MRPKIKYDFEQRQRLENEIVPACIDDPEYAAAEILRLEIERDEARETIRRLKAENERLQEENERLIKGKDTRERRLREALAKIEAAQAVLNERRNGGDPQRRKRGPDEERRDRMNEEVKAKAKAYLKDLAWVVFLGAMLGLVLASYGCGGEEASNARGVASPTLPEVVSAVQEPVLEAQLEGWELTLNTSYEGRLCVCEKGPGETQTLVGEIPVSLEGAGTIDAQAVPGMLSHPACQVQIDLTRGECACPSPLGPVSAFWHLGSRACGEPPTEPPTEPPASCEPVLTETTEYGPWSACVPIGDACERTREVIEVRTWTNPCTGETEIERRAHGTEREPCTCPLPPQEVCPFPEVEVLTWSGASSPEEECAAFGPYVLTRDPVFWICKAGKDHEVWSEKPPTGEGAVCRNGKKVSHATSCGC